MIQVGAVAMGVAAVEWSPDGELLCLVSSAGELLLMNKACTMTCAYRAARL